MRFDEILSSVLKKVLTPEIPAPSPATLPHEPEPRVESRTIAGVNINDVRESWFAGWNVPEEFRPYWRQFNIIVSLQYGPDVPAATSAETDTMWIRPEWANPGVIAHELAHESYSLLSDGEKAAFSAELENLKNDSRLVLLYSRIPYAKANVIEAHAEIYRYLGQQMPETLKKYYPKMLK